MVNYRTKNLVLGVFFRGWGADIEKREVQKDFIDEKSKSFHMSAWKNALEVAFKRKGTSDFTSLF